jgi:hypothetical protein
MARDCIEQIDLTIRLVELYPNEFELVREPEDVARVYAQGKIASSIGIEGYVLHCILLCCHISLYLYLRSIIVLGYVERRQAGKLVLPT